MREKFKCKGLSKGKAFRCKTKNLQNEVRKAKAQAKRKHRRSINRQLKQNPTDDLQLKDTKPYTSWDIS